MLKSVLVGAALLAASGTVTHAQTMTTQLYMSGLSNPVFATHAGDGSGRLFVLEQTGRIRIIDSNGNLQATPFLDIDAISASGGERGLLGLAFHPDYDNNGKFYINYTNNSGSTVVAEGKPVESVSQLLARLDDFKPGDTVGVTVLRQGRTTTLPVTLGTDG